MTLFLNKNKKLILVTKYFSSVEQVAEYVLRIPEADVRIIDSSIVSKYIVRDIDTYYSLEEIISDLKTQDILVSKVVRFKRKGSSAPIPRWSKLFVQWNLRGFISKLHWLQLPPFSTASVLVLQESFLKVSSAVTLRNKKNFRAERSGSPGGCLVTAVSDDLPAQLVSFSLPHSEVEVLGVRLWIGPNSNSPVTVVNVYSPRGIFTDGWLDSLFSQLIPQFFILGDFNTHHPALGSHFTSTDANMFLN
ncbi:hypothetical protein AVEN_181386-1 [Araneus ventricosus]|uniref:Endonuclease/exonuclease/phosphatase domain-containing protein n=1 Tax=Araneus ventricosus TaxID=182803 RepID=A0A4Y2Q5P0_ARAVE|nr:hypothetical protein AVEN_181386-1 [Araneus ventricosus]